MKKINSAGLEELIAKCLKDFYTRRLQRVNTIKLKTYLLRKNPYLYRAIGTEKAGEIVEEILKAYISSSDETIFGDAFFEPIAKLVSGGTVSPSEGVDIAIESSSTYKAIAVKSGPNPFDSSAKKRQSDEFATLRKRLYKIHKRFDPVVGHAYGKLVSIPSRTQIYRDVSGQKFWTELTGDPEFYLKLVRLMKDEPSEHRKAYSKAWGAAVTRLTVEFAEEFCNRDYTIDWEKLTKFNSGSE
ncbi:MAG: PmeII family type II restriction endonuclease [Bacteroidota bacterium]